MAAAYRAVTEVALHVGTFRNVDLFQRGIYHLHFRILPERGMGAGATPPHVFLPETSAGTGGVFPAGVDEDNGVFWTRSVLIRYNEEEAEINDVACFRLEHDIGDNRPLALEARLMFADDSLGKFGGEESLSEDELGSTSGQIPAEIEFASVSLQRILLHGVSRGLHSYYPVEFDELHFCQVGFMVHASLVDFRLRFRPIEDGGGCFTHSGSAPPTLAETLIDLADRAKDSGSHDGQSEQVATYAGGGIFFSGLQEADEERALAQAVDSLQCEYVSRLVTARAELVALLELVAERQVGPKVSEAVPPIRLPGHDEWSPGTEASVPEFSLDMPVPISSRLESVTTASAMRVLAEDLSYVSSQVVDMWKHMLGAMTKALHDFASTLRTTWEQQMAQRWAESIFREVCPSSEFAAPKGPEIWSTHARAAAALRQSKHYQRVKPYAIEDLSMSTPPLAHPILFEQRYIPEALVGGGSLRRLRTNPRRLRDSLCLPQYEGTHVFVLVHGFAGNSFDMRMVRNSIALVYPKAHYLCSRANEEDTEGDITQMGENLADEVRSFLQDWHMKGESRPASSVSRLSFITHSVGGLVVRSALPHLMDFKDKLYTFLSFSSPHLGYVYPSSTLFKTGLWVARKVRQSKCLEQLSMTDSPDPETTFINQLSQAPGLEHFKHIGLVSSYQDQYAPFESARIEMSSAAQSDPKFGPLYERMVHSVLGRLNPERVVRFDFDLHIPEKNIDTMIGRAAHIHFIESRPLMQMFVLTHSFLFE